MFLGMAVSGLCMQTNAQVANYSFVHERGGLESVESYPGAIITEHAIQEDYLTPEKVAMPFAFRFGGVLVDSVGIHENGYIWFGAVKGFGEMTIKWPISTVHISAVKGIVSALGLDLARVQTATQNTTIKTAVVGTSPARIFIIEWNDISRAEALDDPAGPDRMNFQIKLYETPNRVEIAYGTFDLNENVTADGEIGLKGASYADFSNRVIPSGNWSATVAGIRQDDRVALNKDSKPGYGQLLVWEPFRGGTAIPEVIAGEDFKLYPVPAKDKLFIEGFKNNHTTAFTITDLAGRTVAQGTYNGKGIDVSGLHEGMYVLSLLHKDAAIHKTFIKYSE